MARQRSVLSSALSVILSLCTLLTGCQGAPADPAPSTDPVTPPTELPKDIMQKTDPAKDDTINILMIGSSFCYYYVEELYGLAKEAGIKMRVCNVYYSGCKLSQHCNWWLNKESNYDYYTTDENGRIKAEGKVNLEWCLQQQNWDVISLQESTGAIYTEGAETHLQTTKLYLDALWGYIKKNFPLSRHLWHQPWTYQIGYDRNGYQMTSFEQQETNTQMIKEYAIAVCEKYVLERVNTGEAWQLARKNTDIGDTLCARIGYGTNDEGDFYHDGDIGGGQYLNACVWFEVITGQSCVGNLYRPDYPLSDAKIAGIQQCAHEAVAALGK